MKEVRSIMRNDRDEAQVEVEHSGNIITEMLLFRPDIAYLTQMDADILYYVAGFISKGVKKAVNYVACADIVGENSGLEINIESMIPEIYQVFVDIINRGGLVKTSDLAYALCALA